jgi:alpha-beta hydrolase superfamily lysophospholipase
MGDRSDYFATGPFEFSIEEGEWPDEARSRSIPWKHYRPQHQPTPATIIYSHGLGGGLNSGKAWASHWASWGIDTLAIQHPGTDETALGENSPLGLRRLLRTAADKAQLATRQADLTFALDRAEAEMPNTVFGIAGHSYGAVSALRLLGERRGSDDTPADPRLLAAVLFSPSARGGSLPLAERFSAITTPCLHLTGNADSGIGPGDISAADRCLPFRHISGPGQLLLVLDGAGHLSLAGQGHGNEALIGLLQAGSTAFWLAHLQQDRHAQNWLADKLPAALSSGDRLEQK